MTERLQNKHERTNEQMHEETNGRINERMTEINYGIDEYWNKRIKCGVNEMNE